MSKLASLLVQRGVASMRAVEDAIARQVFQGGDLPTNLLEIGAVREEALTPILAETLALPAAPAGKLPAPGARVLRLVPGELAQRYGIFPVDLHDRTLLVATSEPISPSVEDDLGFALDLSIEQVAAPMVRIRQAIAEHYGIPAERRVMRLVARLDGLADPSPSAVPPPERDLLRVKMPRPVSVPSPNFGTGVPASEVVPARLFDEKPAAKTPFVASHDFVNPSIPKSPALPTEMTGAPPARRVDAEPPASSRDRGASRALAGLVHKAIREERAVAAIDTTKREERPLWRAATRRRGPFTTAMAEQEMEDARTSDDVVAIVFAFAQQFFEYTALFIVHGDRAEGRDAMGRGAPRDEVARLEIPLDLPSALARVRSQRAPWIGRLAADGVDADLSRSLKRSSRRAIALLPIVVRARVVAVVLGDDGDVDPELTALGDVIALVALAGTALERIALRKKLGPRAPEVALNVRREEATRDRARARPAEAHVAALAQAITPRPPEVARVETLPHVELGGDAEVDEIVHATHEEPAVSFEEDEPVIDDSNAAGTFHAEAPALAASFASSGPRTARYFDDGAHLTSIKHTDPSIGGIPFPDLPTPTPGSVKTSTSASTESDPWLADHDAITSDHHGEAPTLPRFEAVRPTPSPARRGPAPIYEGRASSTQRSAPPIGFEPLPHEPPPNATAWQSFPSVPPPGALLGPRVRSERPIPREDDDAPKRSHRSDHVVLSSPEGRVDPAVEINALVHRVIEGGDDGQDAFEELLRAGEHAVQVVMSRFPGPLRVDRHRARGELPAASQCGPILELTVAFRRHALPFMSSRISSPDPEIRFWSAHVLGELRYPEAATALIPRLFDDDDSVRRVARRSAALLVGAGLAGEPVLKGLEDIVKNREEPIPNRVLAIETMGEIRACSMVEPLIVALEEPSEDVVEAARRALVVIARQDHGRDARAWRRWWSDNAPRHRIEWLMDALTHEQPSLRRAAGDELKLITKEYFGYYDDLPKRERERAQSLYRAWWEREGRVRFG